MTAYYDPRADWSRDDAEVARPALETLARVEHHDHAHASVTERDVCDDVAQAEAEAAYERWIEWGEHAAEEELLAELIDWRAACNLLGLDADWSMS